MLLEVLDTVYITKFIFEKTVILDEILIHNLNN
jgi:hypothetical protein